MRLADLPQIQKLSVTEKVLLIQELEHSVYVESMSNPTIGALLHQHYQISEAASAEPIAPAELLKQ